jgi:uncharacterized peroxidase-related enzyme
MVTLDETFAQALRRDWRAVDLPPADRAMLAYVEAVTRAPRHVGPETLDALRREGFDDTAILQITMITAWFNYINRMADALGVGRG